MFGIFGWDMKKKVRETVILLTCLSLQKQKSGL